jgi:hypothetical protein
MTDQPRDWDRELADIDRVISKGGTPAPAGPGSPPPAVRPPAGGPPVVRRRSVALTWFWVLLAVALAAALAIWPYQRGCGLQLFFYLGAAGVTALAALMGALASWSHRRGFAHVAALLVLVWATFVALREVLPRVGYARTSRTWMCEALAPAPAGTAPAGTAPASPGTATTPQ